MKNKKIIFSIYLAIFILSVSVFAQDDEDYAFDLKTTFDKEVAIKDKGSVYFNANIKSRQVIDEMGFGWNLGNTFDAWNSSQNQGLDSETCWGNPETTQAMVDALVMKGFKAVRIPVTWHNHLIDKKYTIDPDWMKRVKTFVDWCIRRGLYVILNTHHDNCGKKDDPIKYGEGYYPLIKDAEESEKFIYNVWVQIATAFNNGYDHHLIFEGLNEPRMIGMTHEWWYDVNDKVCKESALVLNEFHKIIHKAIRETGGNNEKRFILVTALSAGYDATINSPFEFPDDTKYNKENNKLMLSVHMYAPYDFAMNPNMTLNEFTPEYRAELYDKFTTIYRRYVSRGYHVVVGEMGVVNKNNTNARIAWGKYYVEGCRKFQFSALIWDNGYWDNTKTCDDIFGHFKRSQLTWENGNFISALIDAGKTPLGDESHNQIYIEEPFITFNRLVAVKDHRRNIFFDTKITSREIIDDLGFGWNLGNTFDAWENERNQGLDSETCWGNPKTTAELIETLVKTGFKAIRIPVTWHNHLIDKNYTVDPEWMNRLKTVVDWCIDKRLYVIINIHHDNADYKERPLKYGEGYFPLRKDAVESEKFIYNIWKQIATAFNNGYDHHLIFETLNEPRMKGMPQEWWFDEKNETCIESALVLNEFNKLAVKAIRETGGNNEKRFILCPALAAGYDSTVKSPFRFPDDKRYNGNNNKLMLSVHMYAPYDFAMNPDMELDEFTLEYRAELYEKFTTLYNKFVKNGHRVVVGEMGVVNKNNTQARVNWGRYYLESCRKFQFSAFIWDNGYWDNSQTCDDIFGNLKRDKLEWAIPAFITALVKAGQKPLSDDDNVELFAIEPIDTYDDSEMILDYEEKEFPDDITSKYIIDRLGFGWNLGNTFDAWNSSQNQGLDSETCWGNPKTTTDLIDYLVETGFKAIRIPTTWHNHLIDDKYTIDPKWMKRVKTVVDWCIERGLYVILNTHHDNAEPSDKPLKYGKGYYPLKKDIIESERFIYNVWRQIAYAFNNGYDHHLIFEGLNEPRMLGMKYEWSYQVSDKDCQEAAEVLNEYHRLIHKAIRETGGNNAKRFILVTALSAGYEATINSPLQFPNDKKYNPDNNKLMLSVHMYSPYELVMKPDMDNTEFTEEYQRGLYDNFKQVYRKYVNKGIHVVIGEMGFVNKNNTQARIAWGKYYMTSCRNLQFSAFIWDNGYWDNSKTCDDIFGHLKRDELEWENEKLIKEFIKAGKLPLEDNPEIFAIEPMETFDSLGMVIDHDEVDFNDSVTAKQIVDEMGFGWNLGNTFDAWNSSQNQGLDSETCWGNPETEEELIYALVKTGFKAIRIPITWHNHLVDDKYTIDPKWMKRIKKVVDWCIGYGLYVIINTHHDNAQPNIFPLKYGQGYYPLNKDIRESEKFLYNVWKQIATAFNNGYDHHLIFEGLNEPRLIGHQYEWWYNPEDWTCQEAADVLNEFHQLIHKAIRETGGNNQKRFIMYTPLSAGYDATMRSPFKFPNDKKYNPDNNKLILSVHMYAPYDFAMNPDMELSEFTDEYKEELDNKFMSLYFKYVEKGYHIIAGEMGAINKNNTEERIKWGKYYIGLTRRYQVSTFLWDNGYWDNTHTCDDIFGHLKRDKLSWAVPDVINAWVKAGKAKIWDNPNRDKSKDKDKDEHDHKEEEEEEEDDH